MRSRRSLSTTPRRLAVAALVLAAFIGIALLAFAAGGNTTDRAEAATTGAAMSMSVAAGQATLCPSTKVNGEICIGFGAKFDVIVNADAIPTGGYFAVQAWIQYGATGLVTKGFTMLWPDGDPNLVVSNDTGTGIAVGALTDLINPPLSFYKGAVFSVSFTCTTAASQHKLVLETLGGPNAGSSGSGFGDGTTVTPATGPDLLVNCGPEVHKLPYPGDTDGDGCPDVSESRPKGQATQGGGRDWKDPWDYYDINGDGVIDLLFDILGVIQHYQPTAGGAPPYDIAFDRGPTTGPNAWNMTAPDGVIDLLNDILGVILQFSPEGCTDPT